MKTPKIPKISLKFKIDVSQKNTVVGEAMIFVNGKLFTSKQTKTVN